MLDHQTKPFQNFKQNYKENNLKQARKIAIFATVFYLLFAVLDSYVAPKLINQLVITRLIFTFILVIIVVLTYTKSFEKHWQKLFSLLVIFAGIGIIIMTSYLPCPMKTLYAQGLLLVIFYGYTMNRLLLVPATVAGMSIFIIYTITSLNSPEISQTHLITSLFFQFTANAFGVFNMAYKQRLLYKEFNSRKKQEKQSNEIVDMNKKLLKLNKKLHDLASTDGLTGLANRRHFDETLDQFVINSKKEKSPLSLIMIDIDHFKLYNDYYGHIKGDLCLRKFADILQKTIGSTNGLCARFGGEEFTIILPNTDYETAILITKRIQATIKEQKFQHHDSPISPFITASFGIASACIEFQSLSPKKLVTFADTCLYKAKEKGRNRIIGQSI